MSGWLWVSMSALHLQSIRSGCSGRMGVSGDICSSATGSWMAARACWPGWYSSAPAVEGALCCDIELKGKILESRSQEIWIFEGRCPVDSLLGVPSRGEGLFLQAEFSYLQLSSSCPVFCFLYVHSSRSSVVIPLHCSVSIGSFDLWSTPTSVSSSNGCSLLNISFFFP